VRRRPRTRRSPDPALAAPLLFLAALLAAGCLGTSCTQWTGKVDWNEPGLHDRLPYVGQHGKYEVVYSESALPGYVEVWCCAGNATHPRLVLDIDGKNNVQARVNRPAQAPDAEALAEIKQAFVDLRLEPFTLPPYTRLAWGRESAACVSPAPGAAPGS
jgi:hypothetical protein